MERFFLSVLVLSWMMIPCRACELSNITVVLEKEGCNACLSVNATWCAGFCSTRDLSLKLPLISKDQHVCTYKEIVYETAVIPGCPDDVDPHYMYPVAIDCHCGLCDIETTDCTVQSLEPSHCSLSQEKAEATEIN
ncbi:hypothetical protein GDO86_008797 [Hymenochirus boettgeri]|uniref:Follitropin subunit beta n=1 Tax=Hymenochirus boettgeri TaxID=247094 RepID=A0A8T2J736_9PIPI|nr:hypothetical protein GDO86_008797 [Hymenochirus boettgeri]